MKFRCEMCDNIVSSYKIQDVILCGLCKSIISKARIRDGIPIKPSYDWENTAPRLDEDDRMNGLSRYYKI